MKRGWLRYVTVSSGLVVCFTTTNPAPVLAGGNAGVHLHKTVDATLVTVTPNLALALGVDKASAIPADTLTYTAVVTNSTATFGMGGTINAEATSSGDAVVLYYWDQLQYCNPALGCGVGFADPNWTSLAGFVASVPGYTPLVPPTVSSGLTFNPVNIARSGVSYPTSGDPILDTDISPAATAGWSYLSSAVLTPAQIAILSDPTQAGAIRNVLHFEVAPRNSMAAQPFTDPEIFSSPFITNSSAGAATNVTVTFTLPDGTTLAAGPAQVPGLASISPGGSVTATTKFSVPVPAPRGTSETEAAYVTRLRGVDGSKLTASASAAGTGLSGPVSATASSVSTNVFVPIVTIGKSGPAQVDAGTNEVNPLTLQNGGGATATSIAITDTGPGGAGTVSGTPASLAGGASGTATAKFAVPGGQAPGPLTDVAAVTWKDGHGNPYGSVSSAFTTQVRNVLFGARLILTPATAGPNAPLSSQTLVATLVDGSGNPIGGQVVTFTITGANPGTGTATTDATGTATFSYKGSNQGTDVAQAKVSTPALTLTSNTSTITWLNLLTPVSIGTVHGNFFNNLAGICHFGADPTSAPLFSQDFPNIMFNPDPAIFKFPPPFIRPDSNGTVFNISNRPFTDVTTDVNGNPNGEIIAQGNGIQAGTTVTNFFASFTGSIMVNRPGDVTFRILHDDGYILGVGGAATRISGDFDGDTVPATTPFNGYPTVAAWNTSSQGSSSSGPATIHFPTAGVYPFELDYTECGGGPLFLDMMLQSFVAQTSPLSVFVGYADGLRPAGSIFPFPWAGSPNVTFEGCPLPCQFDGGTIRLDNSGSTSIPIDSVTVDIPVAPGVNDCAGVTHFDIWPHDLSLAPGQILILGPEAPGTTCGGAQVFDTSDTSFYCGPDTGVIPIVNVTSGGVTTSFNDTKQILNTQGHDPGVCTGNESESWQRVGGEGTPVIVPLPPAAQLNLTPFNVPTAVQGQSVTETVSALDGAGNPVPSLPVTLSVFGPNAQTQTKSTGTNGLVTFTYTGNLPGTDTVEANAFVEGLQAVSNSGTVVWTAPGGTNNPLAPSITTPTPADGSVITKPTPVDATIAPPSGQTVASWRVFYQAINGGPLVVIGSGTGAPPSPLGLTFDPTLLVDGAYRLTVEATASDGAIQDVVSGVSIIGALKLGRYTTSFADMSVPVSGFSMQVVRTYDSTDLSNGDFGIGWRVGVSNFRTAANHTLGAGGWAQYDKSCTLGLCFTGFKDSAPRFVTVVFPDGHAEIFDFVPDGGTNVFWSCTPIFKSRGSEFGASTLVPLDGTTCSYTADGNLYGTAGGAYDPHLFQLTTHSGQMYLVDTRSGLVSMTDRNGNKLSVDPSGVHSSSGPAITFTRDASGRITTITGPSVQVVAYTYSASGDLATSTDADGNIDTYTYDTNHRLLGVRGPHGAISSQTYDSSGRLVSITDAAGHAIAIANDTATQTMTVTDSLGTTTTVLTANDLGDVVRSDTTSGGVTQTETFAYDSVGHTLSKTDEKGATATATYDAQGDLTSMTDALGNTTHLAYDSFGNLTSLTAPDGSGLASVTYDSVGNPTAIVSPGGVVQHLAYDAAGHVVSRTDAAGNVTSYSYDSGGHVTAMTVASGASFHMTYDASGRATSVTDALGSTIGYSYDGNGNVVGATDGTGSTQSFTYDALGDLTSAKDALGNTESATYSANGHLASTTDRLGNTTSYTYDADGRLTRIAYADGDFLATTYDGFGRPLTTSNSVSSIDSTYDAAGHLLSSTTHSTALGAVTMSYVYDAGGNITSATGPDGTVHYSYDSLGRLVRVTDTGGGVFGLQYNAASEVSSLTRPNGVTDQYSYDTNGRLSQIASSFGGTTIQALTRTFDANGLVSSRTDGGGTANFTHDANGRLVGVSGPGSTSQTYAYDAVGNRTSSPEAASSTFNAADELTTDSNFTYTYDAAGRRTSKVDRTTGTTTHYAYDARGQLTSITFPDGSSTTYTYDPLGRRLSVTPSGGTTTSYVYDGANTRLEYQGSTLAASYVASGLPDQPLEMLRGGAAYYYLEDFQGSVTALTDSAGAVKSTYGYDAFGVPTGSTGTVTNPFTYTGREFDSKSGLYYNQARYYDAAAGSFISRDPAPSTNPYPYASGAPVDFIDPNGLQPVVSEAGEVQGTQSQSQGLRLIGCGLALISGSVEAEFSVAAHEPTTTEFIATVIGIIVGCAVAALSANAGTWGQLAGWPAAGAFVSVAIDFGAQWICANRTNNPNAINYRRILTIGLAALVVGGITGIVGKLYPPQSSPAILSFEFALAAGGFAAILDALQPSGATC